MSHLEFIKKQAKQLYKDWKSHTEIEGINGFVAYHYNPKFFNIDNLFFYYELSPDDEKNFSLMKAQLFVSCLDEFCPFGITDHLCNHVLGFH